MELDLMELEEKEKKFIDGLEEIRSRSKKLSKWLAILYSCVFLMLGLSVWDFIQGSYIWTVFYGLLGLLNLHNTKSFHRMKKNMKEAEGHVIFILFIINKEKENLKESC